MWIRVHTSLIRELVRAQCVRYHEWHSHVQKWCLQEWHALEAELTRERGLWGPQIGSSLDKFALDTTEGPCRIRRKLIPNPTFYHQYPYRPHLDLPESKALRAKVAISKDSKLYYEAMKRRRSKTIDSRIVDQSAMINTPSEERGELLFADMQGTVLVDTLLHYDTGSNELEIRFDMMYEMNKVVIRLEVSMSMIQRVSIRHSDAGLPAASGGTAVAGRGGRKNGRSSSSTTGDAEREAEDEENGTSDTIAMTGSSEGERNEEVEAETETEASLLETANSSLMGAEKSEVDLDEEDDGGADEEDGVLVSDQSLIGNDSTDMSANATSSSSTANESTTRNDAIAAHHHNQVSKQKASEMPSSSSSTSHHHHQTSSSSLINNRQKRGPDNQTLLRLLEQGEQLHSMFRCARVQGLDTSEGLLLFGREHYYVVDGFTLLKTREIRDLDFLPQELHDPIVPYMACGATRPSRRTRLCSKFAYDDIREVHRRRYLLQPIAIEVFSADGRNYLLAFPKRMRNRVYQKLVSMAKALKDGGSESVSGQRSSVPVEQSGRVSLLTSIIGQQSVTQRWLRGEMSNFQYLMHLNTLAGRSYNDLSQYPIFPWILSDYDSEVLDLTNPRSFRNLSRPMGAQSAERLSQFLRRYREWDDPSGETPPYMYGTHYSSAMIVVSYLVRLEPFTQQFLKLQGGHFDLADRMFHSVADAWLSASRNNMADVKELIPEFFSLPEMFINSNHFDLGIKQNGITLDDVVLPRWAKAAVESFNVYHHLFYEGNVDFENIDDPLTSNQSKACSYLISLDRFFYLMISSLNAFHLIAELKSAVGILHALEKGGVLALEANRVLLSANRYLSWGFPDRSIRIGIVDSEKSQSIHELCESAEVTCCACGDSRTLFSGSTMGTICVWNMSAERSLPLKIRPRRILSAHTEAITALLGDIATASSSLLFVWSINGQLLSVVNSIDSSYIEHIPNVVLAIAFSTVRFHFIIIIIANLLPYELSATPWLDMMNEWDEQNVIMCGGSDGVVRIYSIEMVEAENTNAHDYCTQSSTEPHHATLDCSEFIDLLLF
ncbi:unnamed protein product [Anisakis simplex]|uniref:Beige/beach protein-related (inferred by orthology to a S. mansoni protein) n=1 Tax=Anisakis simplex TaxID=6269 RepID=A0A0M3JWY6_ANISI|nr:unnamed protein product [Anisakis simplex]